MWALGGFSTRSAREIPTHPLDSSSLFPAKQSPPTFDLRILSHEERTREPSYTTP